MKTLKLFQIEFKKLRNRRFFLIWLLLTLVIITWLTYTQSSNSDPSRVHFESQIIYYYYNLSNGTMLLSLVLPVMSGILISRLVDMEHKGETFKLLKSNSQSIEKLWDIKIWIVYILMEITSLITIVIADLQIFLKYSFPIPYQESFYLFLGISLVNFIVLFILGAIAMIFKNQFIVLTLTLLMSMIDVMSPLFPTSIVRLMPFSYYTLCMLSASRMIGRTPDGLVIWEYYQITPEYNIILIAFLVFMVLFLLFRKSLKRKEF